MPQTVAEADAYYANDWTKWPLPQCPDGVQPWDGVAGCFWKESVGSREVDTQRTAALASVDIAIGTSGGNKPYQGSTYGMPYQVIDTTRPMTKVYDKSRPITWSWLRPSYPITYLPLPLEPEKTRREGDPVGAFDKHWLGFDPGKKLLYEVIQLNKGSPILNWNQTPWSLGYNGASHPAATWDTSRVWNGVSQPAGVVAAGIPLAPLIVKYDEWARKNIGHAMFLVLPNYASGRTGPARGFDGDISGHPLRAGERLRLRQEFILKDDPISYAAWEYGLVVGDRNAHNVGDYRGVGSYTSSQDGRWGSVTRPKWQLSQFEVIAQ